MKCATYHSGRITSGIQTTTTQKKKVPIVFLGQRGNGGRCRLVFLNYSKYHRPSLNSQNLVLNSAIEKIPHTYKDKAGKIVESETVVLSKARESSMECLVRINTSTQLVEKKRINGKVKDIKGWPQQLAHGFGFSNRQKFIDDLWVLDDMDAVLITSSGGGREHRYVIYNDKGDLVCTPELEYIQQEGKREAERSRNRVAATTVIKADDEVLALPGNEMTPEEEEENLSLNELDKRKPSDPVDETMSDAEIRDRVTPINIVMGNGPINGEGNENPTTSEESSALIEEVASEDKETVIHDKVDEEVIAAV